MKPTIWLLCLATVILGVLFGMGALYRESSGPANNDAEQVEPPPWQFMAFRYMDESEFVPRFDEFGRALPKFVGENHAPSVEHFKNDSLSIELQGDAGLEYKAFMQQGDTLVYAWKVRDDRQVYYDFHGHPHAADPDFFTRYKEGEGQADQGTILAAYSGQHGWFWLNLGAEAVTIDLQVAGFYEGIIEIDPYE